ncbi:hypothetical protein DTL21_02300 [Bremerella cremea]|uniref:Uncharacterized protein n=1 Tax=Blastopirellula marina TaxID=124 RepID=A0A2S8G593_9BACT|nr:MULTISPECIES: hypothetical protein [Pirellulaceae]PQO39597.1 hypothetical protein C5Y83_02300 [Blastopirellula marina]RCS51064.1 hypothetical protein DTL21_02300 [Bremerella cremea]
MNLELRWQENSWTSCLHAAQILSGKAPENASESLVTHVAPAAKRLIQEVERAAIAPKLFWRHALPLSAQMTGKSELAGVVLRKTRGLDVSESSHRATISGALADLAVAYQSAVPKVNEELSLRRRPLQEAWEARGPGLMYFLNRVLPEEFIPDLASVILVLPVSGGRGTAHLSYNSLRMEAMLYDPHPQLPEVVRLGWLISQLNIDLPKYSELIEPDRIPMVARLATLPAILYAAEEVELVRPGTVSLAEALKLWQVAHAGHEALAEIVTQWWQTQESRRAAWHVALAGLDRMLG